MATSALRTEKLDLRISRPAKEKLQAAAAVSHRKLSDFVLESALSRADEALADRRTFGLGAALWEQFQEVLDSPARHLPRMQRLLDEPGFFDPGHQK
jgi:uncharacterized protein (DUF1778 family)